MQERHARRVVIAAWCIIAAGTLACITLFCSALINAQNSQRRPVATLTRGMVLTEFGRVPAGRRTVVLFVRGTCGACRAQTPFYRSLVAQSEETSAFSVVLHSPETPEPARAFGRECGLPPERVTPLDVTGPAVVPTLIIVSAAGVVEFVREGAISQREASELAAMLGISETKLRF